MYLNDCKTFVFLFGVHQSTDGIRWNLKWNGFFFGGFDPAEGWQGKSNPSVQYPLFRLKRNSVPNPSRLCVKNLLTNIKCYVFDPKEKQFLCRFFFMSCWPCIWINCDILSRPWRPTTKTGIPTCLGSNFSTSPTGLGPSNLKNPRIPDLASGGHNSGPNRVIPTDLAMYA